MPEYDHKLPDDLKARMRAEYDGWTCAGPKKYKFLMDKLRDPKDENKRSAAGSIHNMMINNTTRREIKEFPGMLDLMIETEKELSGKGFRTTLTESLIYLGVPEYIEQSNGYQSNKFGVKGWMLVDGKPTHEGPHGPAPKPK